MVCCQLSWSLWNSRLSPGFVFPPYQSRMVVSVPSTLATRPGPFALVNVGVAVAPKKPPVALKHQWLRHAGPRHDTAIFRAQDAGHTTAHAHSPVVSTSRSFFSTKKWLFKLSISPDGFATARHFPQSAEACDILNTVELHLLRICDQPWWSDSWSTARSWNVAKGGFTWSTCSKNMFIIYLPTGFPVA